MTGEKLDVTIATVMMAYGAAGIVLHDVLEMAQLVVSISGGVVGTSYMAWKFWKEWRHSKRRNRREDD